MLAAFWILVVAGAYAAAGLLFAMGFVSRGVTVVDHAAEKSRWTFRVLIVPGVVALWPVMAGKWIATRHDCAADAASGGTRTEGDHS